MDSNMDRRVRAARRVSRRALILVILGFAVLVDAIIARSVGTGPRVALFGVAALLLLGGLSGYLLSRHLRGVVDRT